MGDFVNSTRVTVIGWIAVAVLACADLALVYSVLTNHG